MGWGGEKGKELVDGLGNGLENREMQENAMHQLYLQIYWEHLECNKKKRLFFENFKKEYGNNLEVE